MTEDEKKLEAAEFQRIQDKYAADAHFGYQKLRTMPDINLKQGLPQDAYTNQPHPVRENCSCIKCVTAFPKPPAGVPVSAPVPTPAASPHPFSATCQCEACAATTAAVLAAQPPAQVKNKPGRKPGFSPKKPETQPEAQEPVNVA